MKKDLVNIGDYIIEHSNEGLQDGVYLTNLNYGFCTSTPRKREVDFGYTFDGLELIGFSHHYIPIRTLPDGTRIWVRPNADHFCNPDKTALEMEAARKKYFTK